MWLISPRAMRGCNNDSDITCVSVSVLFESQTTSHLLVIALKKLVPEASIWTSGMEAGSSNRVNLLDPGCNTQHGAERQTEHH